MGLHNASHPQQVPEYKYMYNPTSNKISRVNKTSNAAMRHILIRLTNIYRLTPSGLSKEPDYFWSYYRCQKNL
jgi:hypothetical protein